MDDRYDVTAMPEYENGTFDLAICSHVLEHVHDDGKAVSELRRVLAPEGLAIVMVPIVRGQHETEYDPSVSSEAERWRRYGQGDHVRAYSRAGLISLLEANGLAVACLDARSFGHELFRTHGISPTSVLYIASATMPPSVLELQASQAPS